MDKHAGLQQRRGVQESGQSATAAADLRFRAFVAIVLLASTGTVLRAYTTIQNDEELTRLHTTAPPVVRVVVLADTHGARRPIQHLMMTTPGVCAKRKLVYGCVQATTES